MRLCESTVLLTRELGRYGWQVPLAAGPWTCGGVTAVGMRCARVYFATLGGYSNWQMIRTLFELE